MVAAAASAHAGSGGTSVDAAARASGSCPDGGSAPRALQARRLRRRRQDASLGPQGRLLRRPARQGLRHPDARARCSRFQQRHDLQPNGVVGQAHPQEDRPARCRRASRPGTGHAASASTACGVTLRRSDDRRRAPQPALRDQGTLEVPRPLRPGQGDRPRPVHEGRSLGPHPGSGRERSTSRARRDDDPRRPDQDSELLPALSRGGGGRIDGSVWSCGSAAAFAIRLWNSFSATCATASSSSSSLQSASRASSRR